MARWRSAGAPLGAAALTLALGSCGGNGPGSCPAGQAGTPPNCQVVCPAGTVPPDCHVDCTQTNIYQNNGPVPGFTLVFLDFSVPDNGRLDVSMDWTNASSLMGFYLVPANTCTVDEFNARSCNFVMRSEPSSVKPRKLSQANLTAGNYRWIVANYTASDESAALQIILSKGSGCPAFAGAPPSAASRDEATLPAIERALPR
jgi:hypothetical protein